MRSRVEYLLELQGTGAIIYICLIESLDTRENLRHPVPPSIHHESYGHTSKGSALYHRSDLASITRLVILSRYHLGRSMVYLTSSIPSLVPR